MPKTAANPDGTIAQCTTADGAVPCCIAAPLSDATCAFRVRESEGLTFATFTTNDVAVRAVSAMTPSARNTVGWSDQAGKPRHELDERPGESRLGARRQLRRRHVR